MTQTRTGKNLYPLGPEAVPADLTAPTGAYKRSAWLAFAGLVLFVAFYVALTTYFGWAAYRLLSAQTFFTIVLALPALFFFVFLVRGLFAVKHHEDPSLVELREVDEPRLFEFVRRVAADTGAPRPHRVFLSARVNAAVFYDLSFWNLLLPSRKNLEIGLGLVNALTLDELKAVVAHEFGHFAQRTMAVGRWVYTAEQVAGHIIVSRGFFDDALAWISRIDIRIAWIGWVMRLFVWAIRALLDTFFRVVVLAHSALSREMEFSADLVAVSVTGSDSLIHGLYRLNAADDAWDRAVAFASAEIAQKRPVTDLFALQTRVLEHLREIFHEKEMGTPPPLPRSGRAAHRVFEAELAQPPRMWSTHPPNREREDNAKRTYLPSRLDERPAWVLFENTDAIRARVTRAFFEAGGPIEGESPPIDESLGRLDEGFRGPVLEKRYRGAYLRRSVVSAVARVEDLYEPIGELDREEARTRLDALYPESLSADLEKWRDLEREKAMLQALQDGILTAPGGVIRHRGEEIPRKRLTEVVERVRGECQDAEERVLAHDRACRSAHRAAARMLNREWESYLVSLARLLHYADHAAADVRDAADHMHHVMRIVFADGHVSDSEYLRLLDACRDVWHSMDVVFARRDQVALPPALTVKLKKEHWSEVLPGSFDLPPPEDANFGQWLEVVDSWAFETTDALSVLASVALEELLEAEAQIERSVREGTELPEAPLCARVPKEYTTLVIGQERERQKKLGWWDRFQLADGFLPGAARFAAASLLLAPALAFTFSIGGASVSVYNGLGIPVHVDIDGEEEIVQPRSSVELEPAAIANARVVTKTLDGRTIERFEIDIEEGSATYVYNVAGASPLVEWIAAYGNLGDGSTEPLGAPRFSRTNAEVLFSEPPGSVHGNGPTTRLVLSGLAEESPYVQSSFVEDIESMHAMARAHVRWDASTDPNLALWLGLLGDSPEPRSLVRARLREEPHSVLWLSWEQYFAGSDRSLVCARHRDLASRAPNDAGLEYVAAGCIDDRRARAAAIVRGHDLHPSNPWFTMAMAQEHARTARWLDALRLLHQSRTREIAPLWPGLAVDAARMRRALASDPSGVDLDDLSSESPALAAMLAMEDPDGPQGQQPWPLLSSANFEQALSVAGAIDQSGVTRHRVLRLIAASEGVSEELHERAWTLLPEEGIDEVTVWSTFALAVRDGRDTRPFLDKVRESARGDADVMLSLPDLVRTDPARFEDALSELRPELRGHALVMAIVLLGESAPPSWRHDARALLFVIERPYFRDEVALQDTRPSPSP